jgi:hypothetical protein
MKTAVAAAACVRQRSVAQACRPLPAPSPQAYSRRRARRASETAVLIVDTRGARTIAASADLSAIPGEPAMTCTPSTLAFALTAALAAPIALAQSGDTTQRRQVTPATQTEAVVREQLLTTNAPVAEQLDETRPPPVSNALDEEEEEAMRRDRRPPERNRARTRVADESVPARRDLWSELDVNGDGRISVVEGEANADFKSNFEMMDTDDDGYVSDAEYRSIRSPEGDRQGGRDGGREGRDGARDGRGG